MADALVVTEDVDVGAVYPDTGDTGVDLGQFSVGADFTIPNYTPSTNVESAQPGTVTPVKPSEQTVSVPVASMPVQAPTKSAVAVPVRKLISSNLISPSASVVTPTSPVGGISMDSLVKVSNAINDPPECKDMPALVKLTGLDEDTITKCVAWLNSQGLAPVSANVVCSVAAVKKLQAQLAAFSG